MQGHNIGQPYINVREDTKVNICVPDTKAKMWKIVNLQICLHIFSQILWCKHVSLLQTHHRAKYISENKQGIKERLCLMMNTKF